MKTTQHITIFLASPGDVQPERDAAREIVEELNRVTARQNNIHFDIVGWDTGSYPGFGGDGQHVLNGQIGDMEEYDLFVGIMWNKFGSPTPRAGSGTEEEFQRAFETYQKTGKPDIAFYFKNEPVNLASEAELAQKIKVVQFKKSLFSHGLIGEFIDTNDFRSQFRRHMEQRLAAYNITPSSSRKAKTELRDLLTIREREVLDLMLTGASNSEISSALFVSTDTIKIHTSRIFQKLGVSSRLQVIQLFASTSSGTNSTQPGK